MTLPSRQCGNGGRSQSRPFPARAVKVMESAAQRCDATVNAASLRTENEVQASAKCVTAGETAQSSISRTSHALECAIGVGPCCTLLRARTNMR